MFEAYFSLLIFSFLLLGSPGPAPLAIAATGAVYGIQKGLTFLIGLVIGFILVVSIQGVAMHVLVSNNQAVMQVLQLFGLLYVVYIALKIARAPINQDGAAFNAPPNCLDGIILNVTNPKAYAAMTVIYSQFLLPHENTTWAYLLTALVCVMVVICIDLIWLLLGKILKPVMQHPSTGRILRVVFAVAMILVVLWMVIKNIIK